MPEILSTPTTVGRMMFEDIVPAEHRAHLKPDQPITKDVIVKALQDIAEKDPRLYREVSHRLLKLGAKGCSETRTSFSLADLENPLGKAQLIKEINASEDDIYSNPGLDDEGRQNALVELYNTYSQGLPEKTYQASIARNNNLAHMVAAGARGNKLQLNSNLGMDALMVDYKDRPIPIGIKNSYSEGLSPAEYWAGAYGTRKGLMSVKIATPQGGYFGKQLSYAANETVITEKDCGTKRGYQVMAEDPDNVGSVLSRDVGGYKEGTPVSPKMMSDFKARGIEDITVRSPLTCEAKGTGLCSMCAGIRERNSLPPLMDNIGLAASSALAEPMAQGMLSQKHTGGVASASGVKKQTVSGFQQINQMAQVPEIFRDKATVAELDGRIDRIEPAPQGGQFLYIGEHKHYVAPEHDLRVKQGQEVEAGDQLTDGIVNPADVVRLKGVGEGRNYFVKSMRQAFKDNGLNVNRRNIEVLTRSLVNHVRVDDANGIGNHLPDEVVAYQDLESGYEPREGAKEVDPRNAMNMYLERPALHYTIGTRVTPSVRDNLIKNKEMSVMAHPEAPGFHPEMIRLMEQSGHKKDWMTKMYGNYLKKNVIESARGGKSEADIHGTSFVPGLVKGTEFGQPPPQQGGIGY